MSDKITRLSVNLNQPTADVIRRKRDEDGTSATETIRRAISLLDFLDKEIAAGRVILTDGPGGKNQIVLLP